MNKPNYLNEQLKMLIAAIDHYGKEAKIVFFYVEDGWKKKYQYFEILKFSAPKYDEALANPVLKNQVKLYEIALNEGRIIPNYFNIIPEGYHYEIMNIVDGLYELACLIMSSHTLDSIVVNTHLWLNQKTAYWLAKQLNKSRQLISHLLNSKKDWPQHLKNEIAKILNFDVSEFETRDFGRFKYDDENQIKDDYYTTISFDDFVILFNDKKDDISTVFDEPSNIKDFAAIKHKDDTLEIIKNANNVEDKFNYWKIIISKTESVKVVKDDIKRLYYVKF